MARKKSKSRRSVGRKAASADASDRSGRQATGATEDDAADDPVEPEILERGLAGEPDDDDPFAVSPEPAVVTTDLAPAAPADIARVDPLTRYIQEVRRYPELSREEEEVFARLYRDTGDQEAAYRLLTANLQLVVKIALMFRRAIRNMLDLIQEGNVGLIEALRRFDPDQKVKFSTYAAWWIKAYILKFLLDNHRLVRVGTTNARRKLLYNLRREREKLEARGITATPRLLADHFGVAEGDVKDVQQALAGGDLPIDAPVGSDEGSTTTYADLMADTRTDIESEVVDQNMRDQLQSHLTTFRETLEERDRAILDRRLLADDPETLQDLGDTFGVTREAIRQSEARLTARLRDYLSAELGAEAILHFTRGDR